MKALHTPNAPAAIGPYSQAIATESLVFVSGQLGVDPKTGALAEGIEEQALLAIQNIGGILEAAGLDYESVVKTTCFLKDIGDFDTFNGIYERYFTKKPARSLIQVAALPKGALVEVEAIACR